MVGSVTWFYIMIMILSGCLVSSNKHVLVLTNIGVSLEYWIVLVNTKLYN